MPERSDMSIYTKTVLIIIALCVLFSQAVAAELSPARMRAAEKRAADIVNARNGYVIRVLQAFKIRFRTDERGVVTMLMSESNGEWKSVERIIINPLVEIEKNIMVTKGHDIFFYMSQDQTPLHIFVPERIRINHK